mmetsp:Transcript_25211/g.69522  ORF Transcript_25211/g.69522 Transcript_25211/m.69522 type:complete len:118 (+) Transcript_25211:298-651(+)
MTSSRFYCHLLILSPLIGIAVCFVPPFSASTEAGYGTMETIFTNNASRSPPLFADTTSLIISVASEGSDSVTAVRQGLINWENPGEAFGGAVLLLYIGFSIFAGIKYVVKDGWRPKF